MFQVELNPTLPQRVRDSLRSITQVEPASHIMDDVLHCSLGIKQSTPNLGCVEPFRKKLEDVHLSLGQHAEVASPVQYLPLQAGELVEQAA